MVIYKKIFCCFSFLLIFNLLAQNFDDNILIEDIPDKSQLISTPKSLDLGIVRKKEKFRLKLPIKISKNWYIYSLFQNPNVAPPSKLEFSSNSLQLEGLFYETNPSFEISEFGSELKKQTSNITFYQNFIVPEEHSFGKQNFDLLLFYQLCSKRLCFPPEKKIINLSYNVVSGSPRADYLISNRQIDSNPTAILNDFQNLQNKGLLSFLVFAVISGILAWLTPCVFAIFPLIIFFFSKEKNTPSSFKSQFIKTILFSLGISISFTLLGVVISLFFGATQLINIVSNGWVYLSIGLVFLIFSFIYLGVIKSIKIAPFFTKWQNFLLISSQENKKYWFIKIGLAGIIFTVTTLSCTLPLIGTLIIAAAYGNWYYPILGMLLFAFSFISPLLIFSFLPNIFIKIKKYSFLPKLKLCLGFLSLIAALKFLSNADNYFNLGLLNRDLVIYFWICSIFITLIFILNLKYKFTNFIHSIYILCLAIYLSFGLQDRSLGSFVDFLLPPAISGYLKSNDSVSFKEFNSLQWSESLTEALDLAKKNNKLIFIDFSGRNCINCRWMEQKIFNKKNIFTKLKKNFILVRLYTDIGKNSAKNLQLQQERFGNIALPLYAIISVNNNLIRQHAGIMNYSKFNSFLTIN